MKNFTINDLEHFSGIKKHTIRIWEQRYTFLRPKRTNTFVRRYSTNHINVLLDVALLNREGIKVSRIASMGDDEKKKIVSITECKELKAIHDLIISMAEMDAERFDIVLDSCVVYWGIHHTIKEVLYPFAERVGLLERWSDRSYMENILFVKESIKRKLYVGIEKAAPENDRNKSIVLFLAQDEKQELPLLFINYLLKRQGYVVHHLGGHVAANYLDNILEHKKPDYCITTQFYKKGKYNPNDTFNQLPVKFPGTQFFSTGDTAAEAASTAFTQMKDIKEIVGIFS